MGSKQVYYLLLKWPYMLGYTPLSSQQGWVTFEKGKGVFSFDLLSQVKSSLFIKACIIHWGSLVYFTSIQYRK